jgi:hypothetical protein
MTHKHALPEPYPVVGSPEDGTVVEVARVWIKAGPPAIFVRPAYDDPKAMGVILAELCWQFADAYQQHRGISQAEALDALKIGWAEGHRRAEAASTQGSAQ